MSNTNTATSTNTEKAAATQELNPGFNGDTITLKEAVDMSGKSKVTVLKIIKDQKIASVGLVKSGTRGRPANLYDRAALLAAIHSA